MKPEAAPPKRPKRARREPIPIESRAILVGPSIEAIVEHENLKGAGASSMRVDDLAAYLKGHWPTIRAQLLEGTYAPQPIRRVEIPKETGGTRPLGIPTVLGRFIQQAVCHLGPIR